MKSKKIVLCGAQAVGKSTLLESLANLNGLTRKAERRKTDIIVHFSVEASGHALEVVSFTGAMIYFNELVPEVLSNADIVVYVVGCWMERHQLEINDFPDYVRVASALRKTWDDIPWLIVANKIDMGSPRKALKDFEQIKSKGTFFTNAKTAEGVPEFWEGLQSTIRALA